MTWLRGVPKSEDEKRKIGASVHAAAMERRAKREWLGYRGVLPLAAAATRLRRQRDADGADGADGAAAREDRRLAVDEACRILRVPRNLRDYNACSMRKLTRLLAGGATIAEALEVVRYCRAEYDAGDRFKKLLKLPYIWSTSEFVSLLTAARTSAPVIGPRNMYQSHTLEPEWLAGMRAKLAETTRAGLEADKRPVSAEEVARLERLGVDLEAIGINPDGSRTASRIADLDAQLAKIGRRP